MNPRIGCWKPTVGNWLLAIAVACVCTATASAQVGELPMPNAQQPASNKKPAILEQVGIDQKIGEQLPLGTIFKDDLGRDVPLGTFFGKRPVVMALAYYECPMLCTLVLNSMTGTLKTLSFDAGKDFDVVVISINPRDTFRLAADKKATYVANYGRPATANGWHFLTGTESSIGAVTNAIGFRYAYDKPNDQYAHAAAIYVATPKGQVARYFLGLDYAPRDVRFALVEASNNRLGTVGDKILLLCYHYDPATGKYGAAIMLAVRIGAIATVLAFLTFLFLSMRRGRRQARSDEALAHRI